MAFDDTKMEIFLPVTIIAIIAALVMPLLQDRGYSFFYAILLGVLFGGLTVAVVAIVIKIAAMRDDKNMKSR